MEVSDLCKAPEGRLLLTSTLLLASQSCQISSRVGSFLTMPDLTALQLAERLGVTKCRALEEMRQQ